MRGAERLPGVEEILLPGERGNRKANARLAAGGHNGSWEGE